MCRESTGLIGIDRFLRFADGEKNIIVLGERKGKYCAIVKLDRLSLLLCLR